MIHPPRLEGILRGEGRSRKLPWSLRMKRGKMIHPPRFGGHPPRSGGKTLQVLMELAEEMMDAPSMRRDRELMMLRGR